MYTVLCQLASHRVLCSSGKCQVLRGVYSWVHGGMNDAKQTIAHDPFGAGLNSTVTSQVTGSQLNLGGHNL